MIRNSNDLKKYRPPVGDEIEKMYADMPAVGQDKEWARQVARDIRDFPGAYVRCADVFFHADPQYQSAMCRLLAFVVSVGEASGHDKARFEIGIERATNEIQNLTRQYFDEAESVRRGLSRQSRGVDTGKVLKECIEGFKERPPSACALAVLAFRPTVENMQIALANLSKKGASGKHAKHTEPKKLEVREWWMKWQAQPNLFKNKTAFDEAMFDKTGMKIRTIQLWRLELQKEHTVC